jgi:hypothetical protein
MALLTVAPITSSDAINWRLDHALNLSSSSPRKDWKLKGNLFHGTTHHSSWMPFILRKTNFISTQFINLSLKTNPKVGSLTTEQGL